MGAKSHRVCGYPRADGGFGLRNHILVVSLIDLANDVAMRIARETEGVIAVLTPAGGLSFGEEARLLDRLRRGLARNPNVGGVIAIGPTPPARDVLERSIGPGRLLDAVSLIEEGDSRAAIDSGVRAARRMAAELNAQSRETRGIEALRIGLRSSSSSLDSARLVNPLLGAAVDRVLDRGGAVAFGELPDLAGVVEELTARAALPQIGDAIRKAMDEPRRLLAQLGREAPDPTPTNQRGGIDTIEAKGRGALRRLGSRPIAGVFPFADRMPEPGLWMMEGPGSAAVCLTGLAAAGCTLLVYTVGSTSCTATMPITPVVKVGPPALREGGDLDLCALESSGPTADELADLLCDIASGRPTVGEREEVPLLMLPGYLPPL